MEIKLGTLKDITISQRVSAVADKVEWDGVIVDNATDKKVTTAVVAGEKQKEITLWEGEEYDAAGDWTSEAALLRIKQVILLEPSI